MERIMIIGCGGSGKSTLARKLSEKTGLPVVHLDKLYWKPGWVETPKEEMNEIILREMEKPKWIMDGNYHRTLEKRLERCDTVIYLDFSTFACMMGVLKRVITNYGSVRPDMGAGCPERYDPEFMKWIWDFNKNKRKSYYEMLNSLDGKQVYILKNRREVNKFLENL